MYGSRSTKENMWLLLTVHVLDFKYQAFALGPINGSF